MPLYIDDVEANVTAAPAPEGNGTDPEQFQRLVAAVAAAIEEQAQRRSAMTTDAALSERSRPPSIGD